MATTASVYNTSRTARQILKRHRKDKPSLLLHLHNNHFRFERQNGMFLFDSPVKAFLTYIRDQKVPADLIDVLTDSGVQFFEGCLLVEIHDHRSHSVAEESAVSPRELHRLSDGVHRTVPPDENGLVNNVMGTGKESGLASTLFYLQEGGRYGSRKLVGAGGSNADGKNSNGGVEVYRIVLHPTSETLWADIKMLDDMTGGIWSDQDALEVEAKILSLTAPPLCLVPDPQVTRIANLMLSSTAPPSAYSPSKDSPFRKGKKRGANSIEMEKEEMNKQRREKIMRLMQHGLKSAPSSAANGPTDALVGVNAPSAASAAAATAFVPTFGRMSFIERWRMGRNAVTNGIASSGATTGGPGASSKATKDSKAEKDDAGGDAANTSTTKKPTSKKKKKAQREKEEAEAAVAAEAAKKKAEEEAAAAAAAAAAAKKPKKKMTKKEREERERKEKEEKEKAEKEEKERKEKEAAAAAAANAKPTKGKSKKKQKEEAAATAAAAADGGDAAGPSTASSANGKSPSKGGKANGGETSTPNSPDKDKKASPKKTAGKKPASSGNAGAGAGTTTAGKKSKTPAKADTKKGNAGNGSAADTNSVGQQGTPLLGSATPSVQSTPTPAHRSIPSQMGNQQGQPGSGMFLPGSANTNGVPGAGGQLPFGASPATGGFGLSMMNNGAGNPLAGFSSAGNAGSAGIQGLGMMGQFGAGLSQAGGLMNFSGANPGLNMANMNQMSQMMGMMLPGGVVPNNPNAAFNNNGLSGFPNQQQQQQGVGQGQNGNNGGSNGGTADLPVGVGLAGLANWGSGS